jgi:hypothetical protein
MTAIARTAAKTSVTIPAAWFSVYPRFDAATRATESKRETPARIEADLSMRFQRRVSIAF